MFRATNWATIKVLQHNGCDVVIPANQVCCGAIHYHAGASEPAREFANQNAAAFQPDAVDAVIINVAGCGRCSKITPIIGKINNPLLVKKLAAKVRDVHEF